MGVAGMIVGIGYGICYLAFTDIDELGISPYLFIAILFMIKGIAYCWVPETLNVPPPDHIKEVKEERRKLD